MLSKEGLVHSSVSGDLERHKESYDEEVYGDAFNEIEQEFNCCGSEEDKVEFIEKKLKGNHRYEPILISLICALTNGLDQYIKNAEERRQCIREAVVQAVVLRMKSDDCNNSFWKKTYDEKGNLLALHKACEDGNIDEIERLIKESPFMYRTMIACNPDVTSRKAEDTALHKVIKNKDVSTEEKIKICKIFMEDLGTWNLSDFKNTWGRDILIFALESESVPLLRFLTKDDRNYNFIRCLGRLGHKSISVSPDNFDVFDLLLSSIGGDLTCYIKERIDYEIQPFGDCDFLILYRYIVVYMFARQRDMARLLHVLTNPKFKTPLHFTEDIVEESLLKWISIQEYTKRKSVRTMRDDITFPESDDHYNPKYDFTDPENPLLKRARYRMLLEALDTHYRPQLCYGCSEDEILQATNRLAMAAHRVFKFEDYPSLKQIEEAGKDNKYWQQPYGGYDLPEIDEYFKL